MDFHHPNRGDHEDPREGGERDLRDEIVAEVDHPHQYERRGPWRIPVPRAGADVHRGAGDRTGGRHTTEQRRCDVRQTLAEEFAVRIVTRGVSHAVCDLGGQERFERGEQRHRQRRLRTVS